MGPITNILFPVDFSPSCVAMAPYVKRAAAMYGANVSLIHVFDPASYSGFELYLRRPAEIAEEHQEIALERLNAFLAAEFPVAAHPRIQASGDPASEIAAAARKGFDLIVMPTHAGTFRRMLLGSTTAKVLNDADCPVMTSRHAEEVAPRPLEHRVWLCAIGVGEDSARVLAYAERAASAVNARLCLIHAIQSADPALPLQLDMEEQLQSQEKQAALGHIRALQQKIGSTAAVKIVAGPVKEALLGAVRMLDADVLMIGRSPQSGAAGRLRDLTYAAVRDSPLPVLSI